LSHIINFKPAFFQGFQGVLKGAIMGQKITGARREHLQLQRGVGKRQKVTEGRNGVSINK
jgi:hypothetical protein